VSDHYYTNQPSAEHDVRTVTASLRGQEFTFLTDAGVFSKGGIDFGSELLIEVMDIPENARVLDVGCGYGPIGMTAARLASSGHVTMVDINERAVQLARRNLERNGIRNAEVRVSNLFEHVPERDYDRILTNPPIRAGKAVVHAVFEGAAERLTAHGELWVVIQKKQGAPSAKKKLESLFDEVHDVARDAGFRIFQCRKPLCNLENLS